MRDTGTPIGRVIRASLIGTTIEWYDFFIYGTAAALVFNKLFFPSFDPLVGTLLAFTTYAVGFVARPIGGIVFGHFGDRIGRKSMLVQTLVLMGVATFLVGLLPTYSSIGVWAPILLTALRFVQGFAIGGEWGGAVLMAAEHGDARRRGLYASWPQAGVPIGNLMAVGVLAALAAALPGGAFEAWGWRVPFLLSAVLVGVGLWIRLSVAESPVFEAARAKAEAAGQASRLPLVDVLRHHWRSVLVAMGARIVENVSYFVLTVFSLTYATTVLELPRQTALNAVLVAGVVHLAAIPVFGALSDRLGRRPLYLTGAIGVGVWGFLFFGIYDSKQPVLMAVAVSVGMVFHAAMYGPQAAFFSELFGTNVRYSGVSLGYQLASVFAGSLAPIISLALFGRYGSSTPISIYLAACALITIVAVALSRETVKADLAAPHPETAAQEGLDTRSTAALETEVKR